MEDHQVVAAILTVALCSTKPRTTSQRLAADQWRNVWRDYNKFLKKLEKKRTSPLTGAESIQINSGNGIRTRKSLPRDSHVTSFLEVSSRTILGSRRTGRRLGNKNGSTHPQGEGRIRVADCDSVRECFHSPCIRGR